MKAYLEAIRVGYEQRGNQDDPQTGSIRIVRVPIALLWRNIQAIERIDDSAFCFDDEGVTETLCQITTPNGHCYVVGTYAELLQQWDAYLSQSTFITAFPAN